MNATATNALIEQLGLRGITSVNTAVVQVSEKVEVGSDLAKRLLTSVGIQVPQHPVEVDIMLKSVVEMIINGSFVVPADAHEYGLQKIAKIKAKMPYVFVVNDTTTVDENGEVQQKRSKGASNDKNARSLDFVKKIHSEGETDRGIITNKLAEELGTDYAGAYFYVKKAEKELKIELTAVRGRKAGKKQPAVE